MTEPIPLPSLPAETANNNQLSSAKYSALPIEAIDRLFLKMASTYLNKFATTWQGIDINAAKAEWCAVLGKLKRGELKRGADALVGREWPPNLAEFYLMCRPPVDYESAYREACEQFRKREDGDDVWSNSAIYWAGVHFGQYELKTLTYAQAAKRWSTCLDNELNIEHAAPVPDKLLALPPVGRTTVTQAENRRRMDEVKKTIFHMTGGQ